MKPGMTKSSNKKRPYNTKNGVVYLTDQQKKYADLKREKPTTPLNAIATEAYPLAKPETIRQIVNQNEKNKSIAIYNQEHVNKAKNKVVSLVDSKNEQIALKASQDILDRETGKAITRTVNTNLNLNIEALI